MTARPRHLALFLLLALPGTFVSVNPVAAAEGTPVEDGWLSRAEQEIAAQEYQPTWQEQTSLPGGEAAWQAPNRAHGFRTYFAEAGIRVVPRTEGEPSWLWGLSLVGYGRGNRVWPTGEGRLSPTANRVDYRRDGVDEWYVNDPAGLKQGFVLHAPPEETARWNGVQALAGRVATPGRAPAALAHSTPGSGQDSDPGPGLVHIDLRLEGTLTPIVAADGQAIDFAVPGGARAVHYAGLIVTDAGGRELPAWMEGVSDEVLRGIRLVVDDREAVYPIIIDPLATSPAWTAESNQANALFGVSVGSAGDVNGDGYTDVIVGAYQYDNGQTDEGRAFVYLGSASGLALSPAWTAESDQASAGFGLSVGTAGDVNGDGYADVILGAWQYDNGQTDEGRAFVYLGSASGPALTPAWTAESDQASALFGGSVRTAGDVNGDGYADVIVGANSYANGQTNEGRAFVYLGSASGLALAPAWTAESDQASAIFGGSVGTAGDVNFDGYADVIVGARFYDNGQADEGRAFVYLGSASGLALAPAWTAESDQASARFGDAVGTAGDVNGDGYADVIVGAVFYDNGQTDEGRAFVYLGSASGLALSPAWTAEGDQAGAQFGLPVGTAGDVNGDGYADVIAGAQNHDNGQTNEGRAFVYLGSASGLALAPAWTAEGDQAEAQFGHSVGTAGDVNGDGYADVIVGAYFYDNGQSDEGRAFVYLGSASGPALSPAWTAESDQASALLGVSVGTAGDVNGDGYADVIVGAYQYDNGQTDEGRAFVYLGSATGLALSPAWTAESDQASAFFGGSVGTAGDVNGDGYADVIVGAYQYNNGQTDEGRAFVYLGSASGLALSPAWTAESDQASALLGVSVGTAGDVNGDGYADVIVGADSYDNGQTNEGRAFVYLGSASGLALSPAWTADSNQASAFLGYSVGTAGDVNGDGYADVIVGAYFYDNGQTDEGRAFVYLGSASGLALSPAWTADSNQASAFLGYSVGTAGDVNGDGYADVIVGAPFYDNGQADEGRAFVYLGSASGLALSPAWTVESNQTGAFLGYSVGTAGDVNGDGYADVIVGASFYDNGQINEGRAFVYLGSASGLALSPAWTAESNQANALFGYSVGTAGDVNGDGYADVMVAAHSYDNDQTDEGRAFVYYGNGGAGISVKPQQRRADDTAPIAHLGTSEAPDSFRLALLGHTPFGGGLVKLESEVKPLGTMLDGTGTSVGTIWEATGSTLNEIAAGLAPGMLHHWRVRLLYHPATTPLQQHSRWLTVPWNGWQQADLRTAAVGAGVVPDGDGAPGTPLAVTKASGGDVTLSWGASCLATDTDYEIYEGTIGSFDGHAAKFCSTGGALTKTFTPAAGDRYYLVVPHNGSREGSYGLDGSGAERPASPSACRVQELSPCR